MMTDETIPDEATLHTLAEWFTTTGQTRVEISIKLSDWWLLLSSTQLTLSHPSLGSALREDLTRLAQHMEEDLKTVTPPSLQEMMAAGWDRTKDIPVSTLPDGQVKALQRVADCAYIAWQRQLAEYVSQWADDLRLALRDAGYDVEG